MDLINNYNNYLNYEPHPFITALITIFDKNFTLLNNKHKKNYITEFCKIISYNIHKYPSKFTKSIKNNIFLNIKDNIADYHTKQFISSYFNINIMIIIDYKYYFTNDYNNSLSTIILLKHNNLFIPIQKFYYHIDIIHIFNNLHQELILNNIDENNIKQSSLIFLKKINNYKLSELHSLLKYYTIPNNFNKQQILNYIKNNILHY